MFLRRSVIHRLAVAFLAWGLSSAAGSSCADEAEQWSRFRGPNGSGVDRRTVIPAQWTKADFRWRRDLAGVGHSSPVVWDEKLFITSADEQTAERIVACYRADSGEALWERRFDLASHGKHQLNSYASATPAVDAQRVYLIWTTPKQLVAQVLDHQGRDVWRVDLGPFKSGHGAGVSPIVFDGLLIVPNDQEGESFLVALNAADGAVRWKTPRESRVTYSTPCVYRGPGRRPEIIFTNWSNGVTAHDPRNGRTLWQVKPFGPKQLETAIGSPVVAGDLVLACCGYLGRGNHLAAVRPRPNGGEVQTVYHIQRGAPLTTTPLAVGDLLFLWSDDGIVTCADTASGQVHWRRRVGGVYYGSPVCAGDRVFCMSADGEVVVLAASREYSLLARNELGEPGNSTPAIARHTMYVRTASRLYAIRGSASK